MALKCDICKAEFRRAEHLNRHALRHLGVRPFACPTCAASFARRDSLQRHMQSHADVNSSPPGSDTPKRARRSCVSRACRHCARSKQRCDGGDPCARCQSKNRSCVYTADNQRNTHFSNEHEAQAFDTAEALQEPTSPVAFNQSAIINRSEAFPETRVDTFQEHAPQESVPNARDDFQAAIWTQDALQLELDPLLCTPSQWCFPFSSTNAWLSWDDFLSNELTTQESARVTSMADEGVLRAQLISDQTSHGRAEENRTIEIDSKGSEVDGGVLAAAVQEPTPTSLLSEDTPRAIFTNHSQLSSTFANAFGRPSAFSRDYDDSTEAERSRSRRKKHFVTQGLENLSRVAGTTFISEGIDGEEQDWDLEDYGHVPTLSLHAYSILGTQFEKLNADTDYCEAFTDKPFPSQEAINVFIQSHFEHYHPVWPLLHQQTFDPEQVHWILLLAVAATGCGFSKFGTLSDSFLLQELLRRSINLCLDLDPEPDPSSELYLTQSVLLSQIGLMFSGSMSFAEHAQRNMSLLATLCRRAGFFSEATSHSVDFTPQPANWQKWIRVESKRRLAHLSWMLDGQLGLFFDLPPTIPTDLLLLPLPCEEILWRSDSSESWADQASRSPNLVNSRLLREYLTRFRRDKKIPEDLSSLNRLFLTLALYRDSTNNQDTMRYLAILRGGENAQLPTDDIDRIALQHNHAFSLLIHMPLRVLTAFSGWGVSSEVREAADRRLRMWLRQNQGKARIIIYHAARLFSHIRNHFTPGHHEVNALLYATLSMWIHTLFYCHQTGSWRTLRLDKLDGQKNIDEWLSGEPGFRLYVAGIGNLGEERASDRLLQESVRMLSQKSGWSLGLAVSLVMRAQWRSNRGTR
ncbi:fungal-specific transcription factor domain-containing protein [Colletotrichum godetiae]|uniref:Fungal-specific transcription factor domain-containing protein n=1 Tax=Colletotrichum godetiae TaxID=1209918 RepID=A0AAJ0AS85_9PEZI|nr:fungal-specific transcription factor domain-containing protein [Colletotrichum godetiae]KAK1689437.1 fungal-specific transcription factor domain-containing protein [Colletotrichum godetiae]